MSADPFRHHPGLKTKIANPETSFFRDFRIERIIKEYPELTWDPAEFYTEAEREAKRAEALAGRWDDDLLIFAYGSLMWDPAFHFTEVCRARAPHHERKFNLLDDGGGRGSRDAPGLMAALDHGDGCEGLVFRIACREIDKETEILWRREMVASGYNAEFIAVVIGNTTVEALTFVANHESDAICDLPYDEQVELIATGKGILGTSRQYLENIVSQFETLGIEDPQCEKLLEDVTRRAEAIAS